MDTLSGGRGPSADISRTRQQRHRSHQRARSARAGGGGARHCAHLCAGQENSGLGALAGEARLGAADPVGRTAAHPGSCGRDRRHGGPRQHRARGCQEREGPGHEGDRRARASGEGKRRRGRRLRSGADRRSLSPSGLHRAGSAGDGEHEGNCERRTPGAHEAGCLPDQRGPRGAGG